MITNLTKDKNTVELDESFVESSSFGIADAAKAFHAITTQIYKNPEYSVIAEICANAWDSHILAKKTDIAFNIHLPNRFEPFFSVRDFGVSMTHSFMLEKYSQAFLSTKDNTNKQNGAFGIGRLTCLALNDTYNAICYLDGVKRTYSIYKEDSIPKITLLSTEDSTEPNGFEVSVNVPSNYNYDTFASNCGKILAFYPIKMNVTGYADFSYSLPQYDLRINDNGLNFGFPKDKSSFVVMGVYSYPIDIDSIDELSSKERLILNNGIHLFVKLGDCSVNLSRDGLFYDKKTKNKIKALISQIAEKYLAIIIKKIEEAPNYFEAKRLYWTNFSHSGDCYDLTDRGQKNPEVIWNGIKFNDFEIIIPSNSKTKLKYYTVNYRGTCECSEIPKFVIQSKQVFVINDLDKQISIKARIKQLYNTNYYGSEFVLFEKVDKEFLDTYKLKESDFVSLKSVIVPTSNRTYNYDRAKCKIFEYNNQNYYSYRHKSSNWDVPQNFDEEDLDNAEGCYVILQDRFDINETDYHFITNLKNLEAKFKSFDSSFVLPTIYGVRHSVKDDIMTKVKDNLTPLHTFIQNKATEIILKSEYDARLYTIESNYYNNVKKYDNFWNFLIYSKNIPINQIWVKLYNKLGRQNASNKFIKVAEFARDCKIDINSIKKDDNNAEIKSPLCELMTELLNKSKEQYNIFQYLSFSLYGGNIPHTTIKELVDMIDEKKGKITLDDARISAILGESAESKQNSEIED